MLSELNEMLLSTLINFGLQQSEVEAKYRIKLDESFVDKTTTFSSFECVASFIFGLINPIAFVEVFGGSPDKIVASNGNKKAEADWRKKCTTFTKNSNLPKPSFQLMKSPFDIELFEYFEQLMDHIPFKVQEREYIELFDEEQIQSHYEAVREAIEKVCEKNMIAKEELEELKRDNEHGKQILLELEENIKSIAKPDETDKKSLKDTTAELQKIHNNSKSLISACSVKEFGLRVHDVFEVKNNNFPVIFKQIEVSTDLVEKHVNVERSNLVASQKSEKIEALQKTVSGLKITHSEVSVQFTKIRAATCLPDDIESILGAEIEGTLEINPKNKDRRKTVAWKPKRRCTMAEVNQHRERIVREKTPPKCPSPTKKTKANDTELNIADEFDFFSNRKNSTQAWAMDDSLDLSLDLSQID